MIYHSYSDVILAAPSQWLWCGRFPFGLYEEEITLLRLLLNEQATSLYGPEFSCMDDVIKMETRRRQGLHTWQL